MTIDTVGQFLTELERAGELKRVSHPVSVDLELCEIADRVMKMPGGGPALLVFETVMTRRMVRLQDSGPAVAPPVTHA